MVKEDLEILTDDGNHQCYNYETPKWRVENPLNVCKIREFYQQGHPLVMAQLYPACGECSGYDQHCNMYKCSNGN
mgnify:CR=1 FL=1